MTSRRVLVTGGGGFVGSHLAEGLAELGWAVTALDREFDDCARTRLHRVDLVVADLGDPAVTLPHAQVIVHAAAMTTDARELGWSRAGHVAANLLPLETVLAHARRLRPDAVVFLSSSGVFSHEDGLECLADADLPTARTPYAVAKQLGEAMVAATLDGWCAAHVVRLGYVYGPHETVRPSRTRVSAVAEWLTAARRGQPLEIRADDPRRDWTFAPDLAPALARLLDVPARSRPIHLASPHVLSDSAMARVVAAAFDSATCARVEPPGPAKAPMRASDLCCLRTFPWTEPSSGIARILSAENRS